MLVNHVPSQQRSKEEYKLLHISYKDHVTNEEVCAKIQQAIGPHKDLTIVKRRKLQLYGHVSRSSGLAEIILQGTVKGGKRWGRQKKRWEDNIREWTDRPGVRQVPEGSGEQGKMEKTGYKIICGAPLTLAVKGLTMMMLTESFCILYHLYHWSHGNQTKCAGLLLLIKRPSTAKQSHTDSITVQYH